MSRLKLVNQFFLVGIVAEGLCEAGVNQHSLEVGDSPKAEGRPAPTEPPFKIEP